MEIVDAHVHLWQPSARPWYPAMQDPEAAKAFAALGDVTRMARDFLAPQLREETTAVELLGLVHVSATSAPRVHLEELPWVDGVLDEIGLPAATIGALEPDQSRAAMEADLEAQSQSPRFRGIRILTGLDPAGGSATDVCAALDERDLVFDLVVHPASAAGFAALLETWPDLHVVLEHAGWPTAVDADGLAEWRAGIDRLAALPNVDCKVSGLGMATHSLEAEALRPWIEGCLEAFGPGRCMFGGNFPVDGMYGDYATLLDSVLAAVAGLDDAQRRAFFVDNARRAYDLFEA
ncbi:MAG TPA: amidohydrolase family protein [Solirubrobacterales bacterium]|jgi:predicted TIM-barrel fold metal-dependent hydrolase